jgi:hypothetical protein
LVIQGPLVTAEQLAEGAVIPVAGGLHQRPDQSGFSLQIPGGDYTASEIEENEKFQKRRGGASS